MRMGVVEKYFVNGERHSQQVARQAERLARFADPQPGERYLDVGCGNGAAPIHLARTFGLEISGVDVDADQIREARVRGVDLRSARFTTVDATRLPFADNEFHIVATNKVTHHVAGWCALLAEMVRVLKPEGFFIYVDLVCPGWVAAVGGSLAPGYGFPTVKGIEAFLANERLHAVHHSRSAVHYETVSRLAN